MRHVLLALCLFTAIGSIAVYSGERIPDSIDMQTSRALSALLDPNSNPSPPGAALFTQYSGFAYSSRGTLYVYASGFTPGIEGACGALYTIREALASKVAHEQLPRRFLLISPDLSATNQDCVRPLQLRP